MRNATRILFWISALLFISLLSPLARTAAEKSFHGEIADSQCALNVHSLNRSHAEMMAMETSLKTNADCARFCVKQRGGRFVLQSKDKVYKLDRQDLAEPHAGLNVEVVGTLDPQTNIIAVRYIAIVQPAKPTPATPK